MKGSDQSCMLSTFLCIHILNALLYSSNPDTDVTAFELSAIEVAIGVLSACMPVYRPFYNYCFHGKATVNGGSREDKHRSMFSPRIKLKNMTRLWNKSTVPRGSEDEERLNNQPDTITGSTGADHYDRGANDITITKDITVADSVRGATIRHLVLCYV